jgi:hypothetical protein
MGEIAMNNDIFIDSMPLLAAALLALSSCVHTEEPQIARAQSVDGQGRQVVSYQVCEERGVKVPILDAEIRVVLLDKRPACYTETVIETFCYPTLGKVECFATPAAHRTRVNNDI